MTRIFYKQIIYQQKTKDAFKTNGSIKMFNEHKQQTYPGCMWKQKDITDIKVNVQAWRGHENVNLCQNKAPWIVMNLLVPKTRQPNCFQVT